MKYIYQRLLNGFGKQLWSEAGGSTGLADESETCPMTLGRKPGRSTESFKETIVLVTAGFEGSGTVGLSADSLQLQGGLSNSNCFLNQ